MARPGSLIQTAYDEMVPHVFASPERMIPGRSPGNGATAPTEIGARHPSGGLSAVNDRQALSLLPARLSGSAVYDDAIRRSARRPKQGLPDGTVDAIVQSNDLMHTLAFNK